MNKEAETDLKKMTKVREAEADLKKMTKGREAEASQEKMPKTFARFVRNLVSITSDVLTVTCAALDQRVMPSTLLDTNTKLRLA